MVRSLTPVGDLSQSATSLISGVTLDLSDRLPKLEKKFLPILERCKSFNYGTNFGCLRQALRALQVEDKLNTFSSLFFHYCTGELNLGELSIRTSGGVARLHASRRARELLGLKGSIPYLESS